jgi:hypothetical protein
MDLLNKDILRNILSFITNTSFFRMLHLNKYFHDFIEMTFYGEKEH